MKIRKGFVSNSSSSSYIIPSHTVEESMNLGSTSEVAKYMIGCRGFDNDKELISKLELAIKDLKIDKDGPICFRSCNFDTYIISRNGAIYIDTCNNHDFDLLDDYYGSEDFPINAVIENNRFYYIDFDVFVTVIPYESCKKIKNKTECWGEVFKADDGNKYCINCELEKFKLTAKDKSRQLYNLKELSLSLWYDIQNKYRKDGITEQELEDLEQAYKYLKDALNRAKKLEKRSETVNEIDE